MVATFISIVTPYLKSVPYWGAFAVAIVASVALREMPNHLGLIMATLMAVTTGYVLDRGNAQNASQEAKHV